MNVLSLFSGIGAHDLGLERAGMRTVAFCESDPWCRAVLAKHWPGVPCFPDVRRLASADVPGPVDLVTGGFPCQDISVAGKGEGLDGARSGLWFEYLRIVSELRPAWVLAENVPALRSRGFDTVAAGLESEGYAVRPVVVGAWAVGAPHRRDRVWIVARLDHPDSLGRGQAERRRTEGHAESIAMEQPETAQSGSPMGHPDIPGLALNLGERGDARQERSAVVGASGEGMADPNMRGRGGSSLSGELSRGTEAVGAGQGLADADCGRLKGERIAKRSGLEGAPRSEPDGLDDDGRQRWPAGRGEPQHDWEPPRLVESRLGRNLARASARLDGFARRNRLRALGNANPPHVPEAIGRWILSQERAA